MSTSLVVVSQDQSFPLNGLNIGETWHEDLSNFNQEGAKLASRANSQEICYQTNVAAGFKNKEPPNGLWNDC